MAGACGPRGPGGGVYPAPARLGELGLPRAGGVFHRQAWGTFPPAVSLRRGASRASPRSQGGASGWGGDRRIRCSEGEWHDYAVHVNRQVSTSSRNGTLRMRRPKRGCRRPLEGPGGLRGAPGGPRDPPQTRQGESSFYIIFYARRPRPSPLCPRWTPRQLEAEAAHPAPARGRWKLNASWLEVETLHPASARAGWKRKAAGAGSTMRAWVASTPALGVGRGRSSVLLYEGKGGGGGGEDEEEKKVEWRCVRKTRIPTQRMWGQTEIVNTNLDDVSPSPMRVRDSQVSVET